MHIIQKGNSVVKLEKQYKNEIITVEFDCQDEREQEGSGMPSDLGNGDLENPGNDLIMIRMIVGWVKLDWLMPCKHYNIIIIYIQNILTPVLACRFLFCPVGVFTIQCTDPNEEENQFEDAAPDQEFGIGFLVSVKKPNGAKVLFDCVASHRLVVGKVWHVEDGQKDDDNSIYSGPAFENLDEKVQEG